MTMRCFKDLFFNREGLCLWYTLIWRIFVVCLKHHLSLSVVLSKVLYAELQFISYFPDSTPGLNSAQKSLLNFSNIYIWKIWKWLADLFFSNMPLLLYSVQFSLSVMSNSLQPHELQHSRPPCPSPNPGAYPNPCPLSWWYHPTISSSVIPFSSCPQSFPASGSFQMSQLFASGGQSIGVSASTSVLPMNTQDWFPLGWNGWISL